MRRSALIIACLWSLAAAPAASAGTASTARGPVGISSPGSDAALLAAETPIPVGASEIPPAGRRLSSDRVLEIAGALAKMRALRNANPGSYGDAYLKGSTRWQVSYFTRVGAKEIGQVIIADRSGRVLEQWTGIQVAWTMARGRPGAFGNHVNSLYIWLPMCLLFAAPFVRLRRPLSLINLDVLALLSFSVSLAFFNHAHIYASVPLAYPPLLYLLARMLALLRRRHDGRPGPGPLRMWVPVPLLAIMVVLLLGLRIALNVTDGNVIDVGYAGVIGAERIASGQAVYGNFPSDNEHGDTYGPVNYEAYVPFEQALGWSGRWDDLPAAHAASVFFDLLCAGLMFLIGRRMRGPTLGVVLAYAWASYPFTLYALESNSNDSLVAALILAAVLAATYGSDLAVGARGGMAALAGLSKFAPLALAPVLATHGMRGSRRPLRVLVLFAAGFIAFAVLASLPVLAHSSLSVLYERTLEYQSSRDAPFSVWGLYGLHGLAPAAELVAGGLAVLVAVLPRRADIVGLAAACAAVIITEQIALEYWFYLYIPWFFGLVMIAVLGSFSDPPRRPAPDGEPAVALSSRPPALASS